MTERLNNNKNKPITANFDMPMVSIVVANYNYEKYIAKCLSSIHMQSYSNFECIVVDDQSTDNSIETVNHFLTTVNDPRFSLQKTLQNKGQMNAIMDGFLASSGQFVVFIDADDYIFDDFLAEHIKAHLTRSVSAGMTCSDEVIVNHNGEVIAGLFERKTSCPGIFQTMSTDIPINCFKIENSESVSDLSQGGGGLYSRNKNLIYISPVENIHFSWIWTTTSAIMFRRGVLKMILGEKSRGIRISADNYLFHFAHIVGGTILIDGVHGAYRRHGHNSFSFGSTIGNHARPGRTQPGKNSAGDVPYGKIWDLIRDEIKDNADEFVKVFGKPQFLRLLALVYGIGRFRSARRAAKPLNVVYSVALLSMMIVFAVRRTWFFVRKAKTFV